MIKSVYVTHQTIDQFYLKMNRVAYFRLSEKENIS